jgi:hypothetical protein
MLSHLPLDDELNKLFYMNGGAWRLVWARALGHCVLQREIKHIEFSDAVEMIASGELLWVPPEHFEHLDGDTPFDEVQREHVLLCAFLCSPAGQRVSQWTLRQRIELRTRDDRDWLASRSLSRGDARPEDDD